MSVNQGQNQAPPGAPNAQVGQNAANPPNAVNNAAQDLQNQFMADLVNQLRQVRAPSARSVPCEIYKAGNDFEQWVKIFRDSIKAVNNLQDTDQRVNQLCVQWLPTKLEIGVTRNVYENLPQATKDDWQLLRAALSLAYRDENEEIIFLSNESAWKRTPGMTLRDYRNGLVTRLDKYQPNLRQVNTEWERTAVRRFRAGLENPVLDAHILMSCTGTRHTLAEAFSVACNFETTIHTISQSGSNKATAPSMAAMLNIPQLSLMDSPQFGALGSQEKEKTEKRFDTLETAAKKGELDVKELQAGLSEVKETVKGIKEDLSVMKNNNRPFYQRQVRPFYPVARMPLSNPYAKPYYPQYGRSGGYRPQGVVSGLTGGPGYATRQPAPAYGNQLQQTNRQNQLDPNNANGDRGVDSNQKGVPQRPPTPALGLVEESDGRDTFEEPAFPNPNLQYTGTDLGHGWTEWGGGETASGGYDEYPEGYYQYSTEPPF